MCCSLSAAHSSSYLPMDSLLRNDTVYHSDEEKSLFISRLFEAEQQLMPVLNQTRPIYLTYRQDSITSILKVHSYFGFKPATALLAINYLDRYLSSKFLPDKSFSWAFQLISVACLSLAAKMEENKVPLLVDLQMAGERRPNGYLFQPKTVQRMEVSVMAELKWRLHSVTPYDYLDYFVSRISVIPEEDFESDIRSVASSLIIDTTRVMDFVRFPPSVIAAAAVISAAGEGEILDDRLNREMVRSCHQLMMDYLVDTCPYKGKNVITADPPDLPSPNAVLGAAAICVRCESQLSARENKRQRLSTSDVPII